MRKPDFFIVGAPKSATTAMYAYLRQHPEVFMPTVKELHYFGTDLEFLPPGRNFNTIPRSDEELTRYLSFFEGAEYAKSIGEASVWYLYSKKAAHEIKAFVPDAKIIIMLRNPVDLLYSIHSQFLWEGNEDIKDFSSALAAEENRKNGERLPATMHFQEGLYYSEVVGFSDQLKRYFEQFDSKNILVLLYEDFSSDPHSTFSAVLNYLEVSDTFIPEFRRVNANKTVRSNSLRNLLIKPSITIKLISKLIPESLRSKLIQQLRKKNTQYKPRVKLENQIRSQLIEKFKPDIEKLQDVIKSDLSLWLDKGM